MLSSCYNSRLKTRKTLYGTAIEVSHGFTVLSTNQIKHPMTIADNFIGHLSHFQNFFVTIQAAEITEKPQRYAERTWRFFSVYLCETAAHLCEAESLQFFVGLIDLWAKRPLVVRLDRSDDGIISTEERHPKWIGRVCRNRSNR